MPEDNLKAVIEAMLFSSDRPLAVEKIRLALDNMDIAQVRQNIEALMSEYERAERGMRIVEIAGGFQMVTANIATPFLRKLYSKRRIERLSRPALETLAIVAYKQPVTKLEIGALRDVNIDGVVKNLLEKELIRISGRKKAPGRPYVFSTTKQFMEYFGLKSLEELPKLEEFLAVNQNAKLTEEPDGSEESTQPH